MFDIKMVMFHPKLSADKVFDMTDEERCSYPSDIHTANFKNYFILNDILKYINVKVKLKGRSPLPFFKI